MISGFDTETNPAKLIVDDITGAPMDMPLAKQDATPIIFQNGPINEVGVNGITHEALLAILADRLESFQAGPYASDYNAAALDHIRSAQGCLHDRTRARMAQGIEGTHAVGTESQDRSTDGIAAAIESATLGDASAQRQAADVEPILKFFAFEHLPERLANISRPFSGLAYRIFHTQPAGAERTTALRKLLEAKDAAVRAAL